MLIHEKFENCKFSNSEQQIVNFLLEKKLELKNMTINEIAAATFTVPSTLVRIAHKMNYTGWKELKNAFLQEEEYLEKNFFNIDANYPFQKNDSILSIASKLAILKKESIDDTLSLINTENFQKALNILSNALEINIFCVSSNSFLAYNFQYNMHRLKKAVNIHTIESEFAVDAYLINPSSCALIISYTGETDILNNTLEILKNNHIPVIAITSIGDNTTSLLADCVLRITTREKLYSKIASYSTESSITYLLDILYSCIFRLNYEANLKSKIHISKLTESRRSPINNVIAEK